MIPPAIEAVIQHDGSVIALAINVVTHPRLDDTTQLSKCYLHPTRWYDCQIILDLAIKSGLVVAPFINAMARPGS